MYTVYYGKELLYDPRVDDAVLSDPVVEMELNTAGSFSFSIHHDHPLFNEIVERDTANPITVYQDEELVFFGDILSIEEDFQLSKKVVCRGALAWLNDTIVRPYSTLEDECDNVAPASVDGYLEWLIDNHNDQVENSKTFKIGINDGSLLDANNYIYRSDSEYPNTGQVIKEKIIDSLGGYIRARREGGYRYIDLLQDMPTVNTQVIDFGVNLLDFNKSDVTDAMATFVIPLGKQEETEGEADNKVKKRLTLKALGDNFLGGDYYKSGDIIYSESAVQKYGWIGAVVTFDDVTEAENLQTKGLAALKGMISPVRTIELKAVDLAMIKPDYEPIMCGHYVRARSAPHDFDSYMLCSKISLDLMQPDNNTFTLGTTFDLLTGVQNKRINALNATINTVYEAANQISAEAKAAAIIANQAQQSADNAQQLATSAKEAADVATEAATEATGKAEEATNAANNAAAKADEAANAASGANEAASKALEDATQAAKEAADAIAKADEATAKVTLIETTVSEAKQAAENAQSSAEEANAKSDEAKAEAEAATEAATNAGAAASQAQTTANNAATAASNAEAKATEAIGKAGEVAADVETINDEIDSIQEDATALRTDLEGQITTVRNTMEVDYAKKTELTETTASLRTEIETSAAGVRQTVESDYAKKTELTDVQSNLQTQITQNADTVSSTAKKVEVVEINIAEVQEKADAAQAAADSAATEAATAKTNAATAQAKADEAAQAAITAQTNANNAQAAAQAAQKVADDAAADLETAKDNLEAVTNRVDATEEEVAAAQEAVQAAQAKADTAASEAADAAGVASAAQSLANEAKQTSASAQTKANEANTAASEAQTKADSALVAANKATEDAVAAREAAIAAQGIADAANATASAAQAKAQEAEEAAATAQSTATNAQAIANQAKTDLETANSELATAKQNLATVTSRVDATEEEIAAAQNAVEAAQSKADEAAENAANAQSVADTAKADAATAQAAADAAKADAANAQSAADTAQAAADKAQADVDSLEPRVTTAETKIEQNAEDIILRATKTEVTEAVDNIEIGGRNLIVNGDYKEPSDYGTYMTCDAVSSREWTELTLSEGSWFAQFGSDIELEANQTYTFSIVVEKKTTDEVAVNLHLGLSVVAGNYDWDFPNWRMNNIPYGEKISITYTVTESDIEGHAFFAWRLRNEQNATAIRYREVKLEKGNKATDWTPAPEEVNEAVENAQATADAASEVANGLVSDVETIETTISELSTQVTQTDEEWKLAVTETRETITTVDGKIDEVRSTVDAYGTWFTMDQSGLSIAKTEDGEELPLKVRLDNDSLDFLDNETVVAYISNKKLNIDEAEIEGSLIVGGFKWSERTNGNMGLMWIGG